MICLVREKLVLLKMTSKVPNRFLFNEKFNPELNASEEFPKFIYIKDLKIIDINDENTNKVLFNLYVFLQFSYLTKRNFEFIKQYVPDISEVDYENLVKRIKIDLLIY